MVPTILPDKRNRDHLWSKIIIETFIAYGVFVGINDIHCHLLLEESKGQGVQRLACQTLVS